MNHTEKIKDLSQIMRLNGIKKLDIKDMEGEMKIELFSTETKNEHTQHFPHDFVEIPAPLMGIGYLKPSDEAASLVSIGDKIKKGTVLCIIEKMKVMNEIIADDDYEICEICFENGKIVEFGQVLLKVKRINA